MNTIARPHVLIAGGGVAAVEALLALADAAGDRVAISVLTPDAQLEIRALTVAVPFAQGHEHRRFPLAPLIAEKGATLIEGSLAEVVPDEDCVVTDGGERIAYDALIVAVGARPRPAYEHVLTFGAEPLVINGLLADIEEGYSRRIAFVVPPGVAWPLPAYELALMTRKQATAMGMDPEITVVTPEASPLAVFGRAASLKVASLLEQAGIDVRTGAHATIGPSGASGSRRRARRSSRSASWRYRSSRARGSPACRTIRTGSCRSTSTPECWICATSTAWATPPTTRSSKAGWRPSRPMSPRSTSPRTRAPR